MIHLILIKRLIYVIGCQQIMIKYVINIGISKKYTWKTFQSYPPVFELIFNYLINKIYKINEQNSGVVGCISFEKIFSSSSIYHY